MTANNFERLLIVDSCINKLDYSEFAEKCAEKNVQILSPFEWLHKIAMYLVAKDKYQDEDIKESYIKTYSYFQELYDKYTQIGIQSQIEHDISVESQTFSTTTGCCGGGQVR